MIATISNLGSIVALFGASLIATQVWPAGSVAAVAGLVAMAATTNAVIVVAFSIGHLGPMTSELHGVASDAGLGAAMLLVAFAFITISGSVLAAVAVASVRRLRALVQGPVQGPVKGRSASGASTWR